MVEGKKELVYYFFLNLISKGFTYILLLVFANLFTQEQYGEASYIYAFFSIIFIFSFIGLPDIFVVWFIKNKDVSSIFYFLLLAFILYLLATGYVYINNLSFIKSLKEIFLFNKFWLFLVFLLMFLFGFLIIRLGNFINQSIYSYFLQFFVLPLNRLF